MSTITPLSPAERVIARLQCQVPPMPFGPLQKALGRHCAVPHDWPLTETSFIEIDPGDYRGRHRAKKKGWRR